MKTLRLTITVIFLLTLCGDAFSADGGDPFAAIRDITAGYANSSRRNPRKPPQEPDHNPAQEQEHTPVPEQKPAQESEPSPAPPQRPSQTPARPQTPTPPQSPAQRPQQTPAPARTPAQKPTPPKTPAKATQKSAGKNSSSANDTRAKNICELFMRYNPKLQQSTAKKYADIILEAAAKFKQDAYVIAAIIVHESTVNNKAVSKGGDYGLMQVRWKVHEKAIKQRFPNVKKANDMFDARTNIMFGTEIFADCMKRANNDVAGGLMRYSAGSTKLRDKVIATVRELRNNNTRKGK